MIVTLSKSQAELPKLVEIASRGEDVIIMVEGKPKARLTRADAADAGRGEAPVDMDAWVKELEEAHHKYTTGKPGSSTEQILNEDRSSDNGPTLIDWLTAQPLLIKNFTPLSRAAIYDTE
jgi:antitoxin (DNA-binding transcriptional repressor) of toxin-antitoxin stability system